MSDHLNNFFSHVDKLKEMDIEIADDLLSILLLYSVPNTSENFRCAIESLDQLPTPHVLRTKLLEEANFRRNSNAASDHQEALQVDSNKYKRYVKNRNSLNKNGLTKANKVKHIECFYCHKRGHKANQCLKKKSDDHKAQLARVPEIPNTEQCLHISNIQDEDNQGNSIITDISLNTNMELPKEWCIDSGATSHMCCDINCFESIEPIKNQRVRLANDKLAQIKGKGTAILFSYKKNKLEKFRLENALYVPELKANLISVSKVTAKGKRIMFTNMTATILGEKDEIITTASRKRDLYIVDTRPEYVGMVCENKNTLMDWHYKYGHLNESDLWKLINKNMVNGLPDIRRSKMNACEICLKGKQAAIPIPKRSEPRKLEILELIHSDVCGPIKQASVGGARYFATFIDDTSRLVHVYILKTKDEVKSAFLKFKALVERQTGKRIKALRTDNGLEYLGKEFTNELENCGIRREFTTPHTPQQNGVAERMNRTLVEMARCMLIQSNLPIHFWAEAVNTASYIRNRCPTVHGKTPYEIWHKRKPNVNHLKIFGTEAYALNKRPDKGKFEARSTKCIFLGYADEAKAFRLWNPNKRKIIISRDVSFLKNIECHNDETENEHEQFKYELINQKLDEETAEEIQEQEHDDDENLDQNENSGQDRSVVKRGRGRPTIIRTGNVGRPRKIYQTVPIDQEMVQLVNDNLTESVDELLSGPHAEKWKEAMKTEYDGLIKNDVWELVKCPANRSPIGSKWVLKTKYKENGEVERRKARLVARGFAQKPGIEYNETFAPVARLTSIRVIMALAAKLKLDLYQLDITMAYTYGDLKEDIYMQQAKYFEVSGKEDHVYHLKKSLYGLKQSGKQWFDKLNGFLKELNLRQMEEDPCVYSKRDGDKILILAVYVDDLIVATNNHKLFNHLKENLIKRFEMRDLGKLNFCLGLQFYQNNETKEVRVSQEKYIKDMVKKFGLGDAKIALTPLEAKINLSKDDDSPEFDPSTYRSLIGSLMYAAIATRPDIMYAVSALSCFNDNPKRSHWLSAKRVLRYLKGTSNIGLCFRDTGDDLTGYTDSDWGGDIVDRKSRTGFIFKLSNSAISWESRKQKSVAISSTEAEYMALTEATREAVYLRRFLNKFDTVAEDRATKIYCDNQSAAKLVQNPMFHGRTKHIDVRHHYVREIFQQGIIGICYMPSNEMPADLLTKSLGRPSHNAHLETIGLTSARIPLRGGVENNNVSSRSPSIC